MSEPLIAIIVLATLIGFLAIFRPEAVSTIVSAVERVVVAFLGKTRALAQKVKRKID